MSQKNNTLIQLLKEEIQSKFGKKILYANDCQILSEQILKSTKRRVSPSTLKRFFGIIQSPFSPSKYTLDTLSIYLKFSDWQDFIDNFEKEKHVYSSLDSWENLSEITNLITDVSLNSLKNKIGEHGNNFPLRKQIDKRFMAFLDAPQAATALIAPEGYGKSNIVVQLTEKYFTGPNVLFPNDIVCLVDGSILFNLLTNNKKINHLYSLIEYNPLKSFSLVFRNNPDLVGGKFILIVDELDEIFTDNEKTIHFIDNLLKIISSYQNSSWYKVLVTCTPAKWNLFINRMQKNPLNKTFWYDVPFAGPNEDLINIPLLTRKEIEQVLKKIHSQQSFDELLFSQPGIGEIINKPYLLQLFLSSFKSDATVSDIQLLDQYVTNVILSPPFQNEKFFIIKSFYVICDYGLKSIEVRKEELNLSAATAIAYDELVKSGILYEYTFADSYLTLNTYVKFSHSILFFYYLANLLVREHVHDDNFLKNIMLRYRQSHQMQCNLVKYIIKILFRDKKTEVLKNIFDVFDESTASEDNFTTSKQCEALANELALAMRKNQKLRETLIPWYAQSPAGSLLYFKNFFDVDSLVLHSADDLDYYLRYNESQPAKIYVCYLRFMKHFLTGDHEQCKKEYQNCLMLKKKIKTNSIDTFHYFLPQIIYQSVYEKKLDKNIIREIYRVSKRLLRNGTKKINEIPMFEFAIIYALHYQRMNKEIIDLANHIFATYDFTDLKRSCFYQFFLSIFALTLLDIKETEKALDIFNQVDFKNIIIPERMKNFVYIRLTLIRIEFLIFKGKLKKAHKLTERIKTISRMLKLTYFYNKALELERNIFNLSGVSSQTTNTISFQTQNRPIHR